MVLAIVILYSFEYRILLMETKYVWIKGHFQILASSKENFSMIKISQFIGRFVRVNIRFGFNRLD